MYGQVNNVIAFFVCIFFSVGISVGTLMAFTFLYIIPYIDNQFKKVYANMLSQTNALKEQGSANNSTSGDPAALNALVSLFTGLANGIRN